CTTLTRTFVTSSAAWKQNLTLYTKDGCGLCDNAKKVLEDVFANGNVQNQQDVEYVQVDITKPENKEWWDAYCFDIPVVHINKKDQTKPVKFMHYLFEDKIVEALNK
ncbi:hypothetical protein BABINDRAFT_20016, partial [Babjeviella inositovora NRRL Y-12698]